MGEHQESTPEQLQRAEHLAAHTDLEVEIGRCRRDLAEESFRLDELRARIRTYELYGAFALAALYGAALYAYYKRA